MRRTPHDQRVEFGEKNAEVYGRVAPFVGCNGALASFPARPNASILLA
jgi:hypothetical protein